MVLIGAGGRVSLQTKSRPAPSQEASAPSGGTSGARAAIRLGRWGAPLHGSHAEQGICDLFRSAVHDDELLHLFPGGLMVLAIVLAMGLDLGTTSGHQ